MFPKCYGINGKKLYTDSEILKILITSRSKLREGELSTAQTVSRDQAAKYFGEVARSKTIGG